MQDHFREEIESGEVHFSGSSGGAIIACVTALNLDLKPIMDEITTVVHQKARSVNLTLGIGSRNFD